MDGKGEAKPCDFAKAYKKLPAKNRAGLIRSARNLLRQQDEDREMLMRAFAASIDRQKKGLQ